MRDNKQWDVAWAQIAALRNNIPSEINEVRVNEYHSILDAFQLASDSAANLHSFRVSASEMKPKVTSFRKGTRRLPPITRYSKEKYCKREYFVRQVEGAWSCLSQFQANGLDVRAMSGQMDYWAMPDRELEKLALKYHIPSVARTGPNLEHWYVDRVRIIDELVRRDTALRAGNAPPVPTNVLNIDTIIGSNVQQGTSHSTIVMDFKANAAEIRALMEKVRDSMQEMYLSPAAKEELTADTATIEIQLSSTNPKPSVITECLRSMRTILENAVGGAIGTGLAYEIAKHLQ